MDNWGQPGDCPKTQFVNSSYNLNRDCPRAVPINLPYVGGPERLPYTETINYLKLIKFNIYNFPDRLLTSGYFLPRFTRFELRSLGKKTVPDNNHLIIPG